MRSELTLAVLFALVAAIATVAYVSRVEFAIATEQIQAINVRLDYALKTQKAAAQVERNRVDGLYLRVQHQLDTHRHTLQMPPKPKATKQGPVYVRMFDK